MTPPADPLHPALSRWSGAWRYLLAAVVGVLAWTGNTFDRLSTDVPDAPSETVAAILALDAVLGLVAVALLSLRRRSPLGVACATVALLAVSAASFGAALLAVVSMATWRRRPWVVVTGVVFVGGLLLVIATGLPTQTPGKSAVELAVGLVLGVALYGAAVVTGYYIGARRELVANLDERARAAEREQEFVREAERTRIAREMHDVLAHRISLVALHAGALAYRDDLTREETAEAARTIQANAQLALSELRQVLGVLRSGEDPDAIEQPQPTLAELPALLADSREAGSAVELDTAGLASPLDRLPTTLSRTAFRVVQEALTNARKHAPGAPVRVVLTGAPGQLLRVEVANPVGVRAGADLPSAGVGLAGLSERAALAGGDLEHGEGVDGSFVLRARLPWSA